MSGAAQFREKLVGILGICAEKGNIISTADVKKFFEEDQLTEEQIKLVFDYLLSQKVVVTDYVKDEKEELVLSEEEQQYLAQYEAEIKMMPAGDPLADLLPKVIVIAKQLARPEIFLGDLIQEGNMGLIVGMSENVTDESVLLQMARGNMQALVESQSEMKKQDQKMADKVNALDEKISKLTEEMGRKISIDELAELMEVPEEEILELIHLAGEELEGEETEEE